MSCYISVDNWDEFVEVTMICDRCKAVTKLQENKKEHRFIVLYEDDFGNAIRFRNNRLRVDLCDDCIEELNEWLGFKKEKEEK